MDDNWGYLHDLGNRHDLVGVCWGMVYFFESDGFLRYAAAFCRKGPGHWWDRVSLAGNVAGKSPNWRCIAG